MSNADYDTPIVFFLQKHDIGFIDYSLANRLSGALQTTVKKKTKNLALGDTSSHFYKIPEAGRRSRGDPKSLI
jgi:hypothetical protein